MDVLRFAEALDTRLEEIVKTRSTSVAEGAASDWADYKARCAYIKGVEEARTELRKLVATRNDEEDDD